MYHAVDDDSVNVPVQKEATRRRLRVKRYEVFSFKDESVEMWNNGTFSKANISEKSDSPADPAPAFPCHTYLPSI